ncbi:MAG: c-type cytochrome, partial [Acidobacteria bacterium]|nr:c-type cytochrome [Acidobacteriota bacterium]
MKILCHLSLLLISPIALLAQHPVATSAEAGRALFQKKCASCHGANAKGGRAPDLTTGSWRHGGTEEVLIRNITQGISGTQMPPFPMPREEAQAIITFLRSGRGTEEPVTGDAGAGRQLFFGSGQCSRCHMVGGRGGRLGPDLSQIRNERKPSELRKAINTPDETLCESFETVEVEFPDGKVLRGTARNQDTFTLQLMDEQEKLHRLLKKDLKRVTRTQKSLMPAASLDAAQTDHLIAFLMKGPAIASEASTASWTPAPDLNVSFARMKNARQEPENWLTYWGDYEGTHYSRLDSITPANVKSLRSQWTFQYGGSNV